MKFCPECKTEYTDDAIFCADCNILLTASLPKPDPMNECDNCGGEVDLDSDFCPQCGALFAEGQYSCTNHSLGIAAGVCVVCQQLFCSECLNEKNKRNYCNDHALIEAVGSWTVVFTSTDFHEAQIVRGKLENAGITTNALNTTNIGVMSDGFMDNSLGRIIFKYPIKIFVPANQYLEALRIVTEEPSDGNIEHN